MPTFSEMFPTYARFFSGIGRLASKARPGGRSRSRFAAHYPLSAAPSYANRQEDHYSDSDPDPQHEESSDQPLSQPDEQPVEGQDAQPLEPNAISAASATSEDSPGGLAQPGVSPELSHLETRPTATAAPSTLTLSSQETGILRLYQAWVELESNVAQAQDQLTQILAARGKAVVLRQEAQEMLEQGNELREDAQRIGDAAWRAFDRGFATDIRGFANRRAMVREIDLSRRTQAELQRNVHRKAWEDVERTRETATRELIKLLDSLASVAGLVQRELDEASTLPSLARSLRDSAEEELRCAEAVKDELLLLGTEALNQLGVTPTSETPYSLEAEPVSNQPGGPDLALGILPGQTASTPHSQSSGDGVDPAEAEELDRGVPGSLSWEATAQTLELSRDISDTGTGTPGSAMQPGEPAPTGAPTPEQPQTQADSETPENVVVSPVSDPAPREPVAPPTAP